MLVSFVLSAIKFISGEKTSKAQAACWTPVSSGDSGPAVQSRRAAVAAVAAAVIKLLNKLTARLVMVISADNEQ